MADKEQVLALHDQNPTWSAFQIAHALGCDAAYVRSTAQRNGLTLGRHVRGDGPAHGNALRACSVRCVQLIKAYWAERGFTVNVEMPGLVAGEASGFGPDARIFPLRSDMINGLPRRGPVRRPAVAA